MALESQQKKYSFSQVVSFGIGIAVGTAILIGGIHWAIEAFAKNDTPVVLVGDSMKFKAGVSGKPWAEVTQHVSYNITASQPTLIVVKENSGSDSDVLKVDIPSTGWEVDEFVANNSTPVASITPYPTASPTGLAAILKNVQVGALCPTTSQPPYTEIDYYSDHCGGTAAQFSQISVLVTLGGTRQTVGTLNCLDASGSKYTCKILFRE
jgi:hypothetical protein